MTAVAVWDHRPTPDELLQARLADGWAPTPTSMKDGDQVLGYAACVWSPTPAGPAGAEPSDTDPVGG
ncbi:hypothetical protein [Haliangium sp.]|uniref:hypothetical protein n=1 Tax=Haliangium sp. TaxID=2663208 RepID=UPI003D0E4993